ncbi:MAG: type II toxin-antitoxin system YafQ family toxin [Gammaproteobacteria bacterium]|nr:type II toxin-antitoxin system YafQ family toxin [Gammaproteobacteria bacterium]
MLTPIYKNKFEKDIKQLKKRGKDLAKLTTIRLEPKHRNHPLKGEYGDCIECHIEPDWLLIYILNDNDITFVRTGSHSDLFR